MSTILDALAKARQEKERRGGAMPMAIIKPPRPHRKGRVLRIVLPAVIITLVGAFLVVSLRPEWAEPVLAALGLGKNQQIARIAAIKPPTPTTGEKTARQKTEDDQPKGFLELLMKSKEGDVSRKVTPISPPASGRGKAVKKAPSPNKMPLFLQKLQKSGSTSKTAVSSESDATSKAKATSDRGKVRADLKPAPTTTEAKKPTQSDKNSFAQLLAHQRKSSSRKTEPTAPASAPPRKKQAAVKSAVGALELFNQGVDLEKAGKQRQARTVYRKAIEIDKSFVQAYINLGNLYLNHWKKPEQAISLYRQALEHSKENPKAHNNMGVAYMALEQFDRAESEFAKATELDAKFVDPLYNLACLFSLKGDAATSLSWLRKAYTLGGAEIIDWAIKDKDLKNLHNFPTYKNFLKRIHTG